MATISVISLFLVATCRPRHFFRSMLGTLTPFKSLPYLAVRSVAFVWSRWQISRFATDTTLGPINAYNDFDIVAAYPTEASGPTITAVSVDPTSNTLYWVMTAQQSLPGPVSLFSLPLDAQPGKQPLKTIWQDLPVESSGFSAYAFTGFAVNTKAGLIATPYPTSYCSQIFLAFWNLANSTFLGYLFQHSGFQQNSTSAVGSLQTAPDGNFYYTSSYYDQTQQRTHFVGQSASPSLPAPTYPSPLRHCQFIFCLNFGRWINCQRLVDRVIS